MNVEMMFQPLRYLLCRVSTVAVAIFHRYPLIIDMFS